MGSSKLHIVMYHYTRDLIHGRYPGIKGLDKQLFRRQLEYLSSNFNVVNMEQVLEWQTGGELPEKALLLTFDDGYIDNYTVAFPLLESLGIQGSFFIPGKTFTEHHLLDVNKIHYALACADSHVLADEIKRTINSYRADGLDIEMAEVLFDKYAVPNRWDSGETIFVKRMLQTVLPQDVRSTIVGDLFARYVDVTEEQLAHELYLDRDHIKLMRRHGMFIGLHGYDHFWLANLPERAIRDDIERALDALDEFIDHDCWVMNYPYGNYDSRVTAFSREQGARLGLCTEVRVADLAKDNPMALPRLDCNDFPPVSHNYKEV